MRLSQSIQRRIASKTWCKFWHCEWRRSNGSPVSSVVARHLSKLRRCAEVDGRVCADASWIQFGWLDSTGQTWTQSATNCTKCHETSQTAKEQTVLKVYFTMFYTLKSNYTCNMKCFYFVMNIYVYIIFSQVHYWPSLTTTWPSLH